MPSPRWISPADYDGKPHATFRAYRSFSLDQIPRQALLTASASAFCRIFLNGEEVLEGPVRGTATLQFRESVPVAARLRRGENHLAALVYSPVYENFLAPGGEPALWLELEDVLGTDEEWRLQSAPDWEREVPFYTFQTGYVERRDLAKAPPEEWKLGKLTGEWLPPRVLASDNPVAARPMAESGLPPQHKERLVPRRLLAPRQVEELPPHLAALPLSRQLDLLPFSPLPPERLLHGESLCAANPDAPALLLPDTREGKGISLVLDWEQDAIGYLEVELDAPEGTVVDVVYGEELWKETGDRLQASFFGMDGYHFCDRYRLREGENRIGGLTWERGGRMAQLLFRNFHRPIQIRKAAFHSHRYPFVERAGFHGSDPLLDDIDALCRRTLESCATDIFLDCPWRERAFWVNDLYVESAASLAAFGASSIHRRAFQLAFSQQRPQDGMIPGVCPAPLGDLKTSLVLLPTNFLLILTLHHYYMATGDRETVAQSLPCVRKILEGFDAITGEDGLVDVPPEVWNFYDWGYDSQGYSFSPAKESMLQYLRMAGETLYQELCRECQVDPRRENAPDRLRKIREATERAFLDRQRGLLVDNVLFQGKPRKLVSQLPHALALLSGQAPRECRESFLRAMNDPELLSPDLYLHYPIFHAAATLGSTRDKEKALARIRTHWGDCLKAGYHTLYEFGVGARRGRNGADGAGSLCHGFGTSPLCFFQEALMGIQPVRPGFREFSVNPSLLDLTHLEGYVPVPGGEIRLGCRRRREELHLELSVPEGTTAILPDGTRLPPGEHSRILPGT
ncbi:MAG: alpha-L-rhamnosidase C-terminal domain-containing protein [Oligosphaeraceae bacterium]